jgi:hypothetical protein
MRFYSPIRSSFNRLLTLLAVCHIVFILFTLVDYSLARTFLWPWFQHSLVWLYLVPKMIFPLNNITYCCSIFLSVMLARERYLAVCYPNHHRMVSSTRCSYARAWLVYALPAVLFSTVLNIPKFLETELVYDDDALGANLSNDTSFDVAWLDDQKHLLNEEEKLLLQTLELPIAKHGLTVKLSKLRKDPNYIAYYIFTTRLLVTGLAPFCALLFFTYSVHNSLPSGRLRIRDWPFPRRTSDAALRHQRMRTELNQAMVLVAMILVFFACNLPRLLLNLLELLLINREEAGRCQGPLFLPAWFQCLTSCSHLLLVTNASTNFFIYWLISTSFKSELYASVREVAGCLACRRLRYEDSQDSAAVTYRMAAGREEEELDGNGRDGTAEHFELTAMVHCPRHHLDMLEPDMATTAC